MVEPFGYFINLKLLGFMFDDERQKWFAFCLYNGEFEEYELTLKIVKRHNKKRVIIVLDNTPYGNISYFDFDRKTKLTHNEFVPQGLKDVMVDRLQDME